MDLWQAKDLREAVFGSVAMIGLTGRFCGSVANTGLSGVFEGRVSLRERGEKERVAAGVESRIHDS